MIRGKRRDQNECKTTASLKKMINYQIPWHPKHHHIAHLSTSTKPSHLAVKSTKNTPVKLKVLYDARSLIGAQSRLWSKFTESPLSSGWSPLQPKRLRCISPSAHGWSLWIRAKHPQNLSLLRVHSPSLSKEVVDRVPAPTPASIALSGPIIDHHFLCFLWSDSFFELSSANRTDPWIPRQDPPFSPSVCFVCVARA